MEKEIKNRIRLGIFVIVGTACFIAGMYYIGNNQNLFGNNLKVHTVINNVNGLQKGNNVRFVGIDVGTVTDIQIINDTSILVSMTVGENLSQHIKKDALATIGTDGIMGSKLVNIIPGSERATTIQNGDTLPTYLRPDTDEMLRRLEETNTNVSLITENLVDIVKNINKGEGNIGKILKDTTISNNISITLKNLSKTSKRLNRISMQVEKQTSSIDLKKGTIGLLTDSAFARKIDTMITDLAESSRNTKKVTEDLNHLMNDLREEKGIAGKLISDTSMANNLEESIGNIKMGSRALNENMEALKHNFLLRRYFRKKEKGKID